MSNKEITNGLLQLGFTSGWVATDEEIILWENEAAKPAMKTILDASKNYVAPVPTVADKLASVGLSVNDLKEALGLG